MLPDERFTNHGARIKSAWSVKRYRLRLLPELYAHLMKVDGQPSVAVTFEPTELLQFLSRDFGPMNALCERAQMFEERIYDRTKGVFEYFDLPFAEAPPSDNATSQQD